MLATYPAPLIHSSKAFRTISPLVGIAPPLSWDGAAARGVETGCAAKNDETPVRVSRVTPRVVAVYTKERALAEVNWAVSAAPAPPTVDSLRIAAPAPIGGSR
jgi:hypothetical protein